MHSTTTYKIQTKIQEVSSLSTRNTLEIYMYVLVSIIYYCLKSEVLQDRVLWTQWQMDISLTHNFCRDVDTYKSVWVDILLKYSTSLLTTISSTDRETVLEKPDGGNGRNPDFHNNLKHLLHSSWGGPKHFWHLTIFTFYNDVSIFTFVLDAFDTFCKSRNTWSIFLRVWRCFWRRRFYRWWWEISFAHF